MNRKALIAAVLLLPALSGGCLAKAAVDVVTLPAKAAGKAVDWSTTSQSEADRNYGRKMRKAEEREGAERKKWEKECRQHKRDDCERYEGYRADR
ncbi:hypothetical protein AB5I39_05400 [Sphingomonas sp. MMS24-J45]|uniref:hypothetical protein n=1 Tax=Sphingomonas sp. MMS24-J45 TaxID=3238806 RepID=UPI0038508839